MQSGLDDEQANEAIENLLSVLPVTEENRTFYRQLLVTVGRLAEDDVGDLGLKLITNSFKEIRYALNVFNDYPAKKISVFGSARTHPDHPNYEAAEKFSSHAAERGYMLISGAGPGIMEATNKGAGPDNSFGLHISLPHEYKPNPYIRSDKKCVSFRYFFSRKLIFSKESSAAVYFPGGFGTHDELLELLCLMQTGRHHLAPIVLCDSDGFWEEVLSYFEETLIEYGTISESDRHLYDYVNTPEAALDVIDRFYSNYHSSRFVGDEFLIRFRTLNSRSDLHELENEFIDLCPESGFRVEEGPIDGEEDSAPEDLYRLVFYFTNQDYGELRRLVSRLNDWD
ncbi:MAG: TIGR00730 family Rossman fold protein [bacterium]